MTNDIRHTQFEARHVEKLLHITKDRLYHWVRLRGLINPEIEEGHGRAGRNKFSFKNLLELSLIKDLTSLKFDLYEIKEIMKQIREEAPLFDPELGAPEVDETEGKIVKTDIWESFSSNRPEFEKDGYILVISKGNFKNKIFSINEKEFYKLMSENKMGHTWIGEVKKPFVIIDLLDRIQGLEQKTGNKLDYYEKHMQALREDRDELAFE